MTDIRTTFEGGFPSKLTPFTCGQARTACDGGVLRLIMEDAHTGTYSDAQIADLDYSNAGAWPWRPPVRMSIRARASHPAGAFMGTMGFGFWNYPFSPNVSRYRLPQAVWFFYASEPSNMALVPSVPGGGCWKAASLNVPRLPFFLLAPTAPLAIFLMRIPALYRSLWPIGQRAVAAYETALPVNMDEWHTYKLEWESDRARFWVDDLQVLEALNVPGGPLGFVAWVDNQYAIATPQGHFGWGLVKAPGIQYVEIAQLWLENPF